MTHPKVLSQHLQRRAAIYVRQSSPLQVEQHAESRQRQYQLVNRAQALGWTPEQCSIIDADLGLSGTHAHNRPGYQRLISMIALREVGIILSLEVSRLARNNQDWYHLLDLASACAVLIADEDGVYNPRDINDRLLLGLKGTISEFEAHQISARLVGGQRNKATRGELITLLPVGMDVDPLSMTIRVAVDQSVRHAVELVFRRFRQLRSVRQVLQSLVRDQLDLPYQQVQRGGHRRVSWRAPTYDALYEILTNPTYAGVYAYGRRQRAYDPVTQTTHHLRHCRDRAQWLVFLPEHHPGYITLEEFDTNQAILDNNRRLYPERQGAPGRGAGLLQGLVVCQQCGRKMRTVYPGRVAAYLCDQAHQRWGTPICNRAYAPRVDAVVEDLFLRVVTTATVDASWVYEQHLRDEAALVDQGWQDKVDRLAYQADLARQRYECVDPANRLVAQTLETEWNARLEELQQAQHAYAAQRPRSQTVHSSREQMQAVVMQLRPYWQAGSLSYQDKKALLRCLIEAVHLRRQAGMVQVTVHWKGGMVTNLEVPKYLRHPPALYYHVRDLALTHADSEIAVILNAEGQTLCTGKPWTARSVLGFRRTYAIPSGVTKAAALRLVESGYITSREAAQRIGVSQDMIERWYRMGILCGKHASKQAHLWIWWTEELVERLNGEAAFDPQMVGVRALGRQRKQTIEEIVAWAQAAGHLLYRLRRGTGFRFYVLLQETAPARLQAQAPLTGNDQ